MNKVYELRSQHLCRTCKNGRVAESDSGAIATHCVFGMAEGGGNIRFIVQKCNQYDDKRVPLKHDYETLAWTVQTNKSGEALGFTAPKRGRD